MGARQHAHERRLAGAVAADKADHLSRIEVDADVADGVHPTEGDTDVPHLHERRALSDGHWSILLRRQEPRRRLKVSKPTARIRTMPATTFWPGELTPMKLSP